MSWHEGSHAIYAIDEAQRVLAAWQVRGFTPADEATLVQWALATASRGGRFPDPVVGIQVLQSLAIISQGADGTYRSAEPALDAVEIFRRLWSSEMAADQIRLVLSFGTMSPSGELVVRWLEVPIRARRLPAWIWLQRLRLAEWRGRELVLDRRLASYALDVEPRCGLSQEDLARRLEAQRLRGELAEQYVVRLEKARLEEAGRPELADGVERVSVNNVMAGYDIASFEAHGGPRYVEVKSSAGARREFVISRNELETAKRMASKYWIAWVRDAAQLPHADVDVAWFRDPWRLINEPNGPWTLTAVGWIVTAREWSARDRLYGGNS